MGGDDCLLCSGMNFAGIGHFAGDGVTDVGDGSDTGGGGDAGGDVVREVLSIGCGCCRG